VPTKGDSQRGSLLGPRYSDEEIRALLDERGAVYQFFASDEALYEHVAGLIADEKVVGWFQGRMEFGPRALGARSILGDARSPEMQAQMNLKIKFRESFRPFAPAVLRECTPAYFDVAENVESPYMLLVAPLQERHRRNGHGNGTLKGLDLLKQSRSTVPAITHVDYSARLQTVDAARHGAFYELIRTFERKTGCPVVINTSFNIRGEPIVGTPADAYRCFMGTNMDALVLEHAVLSKSEQPARTAIDVREYHSSFQLEQSQ
jgi:carbamoyltransferase